MLLNDSCDLVSGRLHSEDRTMITPTTSTVKYYHEQRFSFTFSLHVFLQSAGSQSAQAHEDLQSNHINEYEHAEYCRNN